MCKTLHYTWLFISLFLGVVNPMDALISSFPKLLLIETNISEPNALAKGNSTATDMIRELPNPSLLDAVKTFLETVSTPFYQSPIPHLFMEELKNRTISSFIRNGDLDVLEETYRDYQEDLANLRFFTEKHKLPLQAKRKECCAVKEGEACAWRALRKLRKQLFISFENIRLTLQTAYDTERILRAQYHHNPDLYLAINALLNINGRPLPVYVQTRVSLFHDDPGLQHLEGLLVVSLQNGMFSSDTPIIRRDHPDFVGRVGAISVFVDAKVDGAALSHEFGHLYFLYHHWEEYIKFIAQKGKCYEVGGHGEGDLSGTAANLAESGKMPDLHMPWSYRRYKPGAINSSMSLADK